MNHRRATQTTWKHVPLSGRLEEEPLQLLRLLLEACGRDLALGIVFLNKVRDDRV